ncbi:MAG: murein hydrolase activator EnvC [Hyphomicrobiaceae bacterium]
MRPHPARRPNAAPQAPTAERGICHAALAGLFVGVLSLGGPATAQTSAQSPDAIRSKLDEQRSSLDAKRKRETELSRDVADIDAEREQLNARLLETAALIQRSEAKLTTIEARLGELEAQERLVRGSLERRHGEISKLLGALQRMGRNPPPVMITRREDALQMVRSAMQIASAFPGLRTKALELSGQLNTLVQVMTNVRAESASLKAETDRLNEARTKLAGLMEERKTSLAERRTELAEVRKAAAEISRSVEDLNELIARLDKAVKEKTGLAEYDREVKASVPPAIAVTPSEAPQGPSGPTGRDVASPVASAAATPGSDDQLRSAGPIVIEPGSVPGVPSHGGGALASKETKIAAVVVPKPSEIVELRPGDAFSANPGRIKPAMPFHEAKGKLRLPAHGRRVLNFGEKTQYGGQSKGMVLETRPGAQITAPSDGWVVYAGEFRSYGQLLIINAGGGYHILLAGLSRIDVETGQFVLAREPVGTMSGTGLSREVKSEQNAPVLYIEFRKDGRPVDPDPWWAKGLEKVED